jgi:hypothetical protein
MSFGQTCSTGVAQRCWRIEAVMISLNYHKVVPDFLRNGVSLVDCVNAIHYILLVSINNLY